MAEESPQYGQSENVEGKFKDQVSRRLGDPQQVQTDPGVIDLHSNYCKGADVSQGHSSCPQPEPDVKVSEVEVPVNPVPEERGILSNLQDVASDHFTSYIGVRDWDHNNHEDFLTEKLVPSALAPRSLPSPGGLGEATAQEEAPGTMSEVSGILYCGETPSTTHQPNSSSDIQDHCTSLSDFADPGPNVISLSDVHNSTIYQPVVKLTRLPEKDLGGQSIPISNSPDPCTFRPDVAGQDKKTISLTKGYNTAIYQPKVKLTRLSEGDLEGHSISTSGDVGSKYQKMDHRDEMSRHSCKFCTDGSNVSKDKLGDSAVVVEPYECAVCERTFRFQCDLQFHTLTHKLKSYPCTFCDKQFKDKYSVLPHFRTHSGERPFSCEVCKRKFSQYSYMINSHMLTHTGEKAFACRICPKKFTLSQGLRSHYLTHTGEKTHKCSVCTKRFGRQNDLKSHMRIHSGQRPYSCKICQKTFRHHGTLKVHSVTHTGERPYACSLCPKTCTQASHLKSHMATHTGERRYACSLCDKRFTQSSHLKTHMLVHTGEKPHRCETCQRCFADRNTLKCHTRQHTGEEPYACKLCPATFKNLPGLKGHLTKHTQEKPYKCEVCQKDFRGSSHLKAHMSSSHTDEKPYQCVLCGKRFPLLQSLKPHMLSHTREKPFVCQICSKGFRRRQTLKSHMADHEEKQ